MEGRKKAGQLSPFTVKEALRALSAIDPLTQAEEHCLEESIWALPGTANMMC